MDKKDKIIIFVLFAISLFSRIPLIEKFQSHWDGPQYSIAILRFSLEQQTPAPPGYPLYIVIGKFINLFVQNPHLSLLTISVFSSVIGFAAIYLYGKKIYDRKTAVIAVTIFLTGSTFYFFHLTAHAFGLILPATIILAYIVYGIFINKKQLGIPLGIAVGIFFGIRPQEFLLIGFLPLLGFFFLNFKNKIYTLMIFILITLLWLLPLIYSTGGIEKFVNLNLIAAKSGVFNYTFMHNLELVIKGFLLSFGISSIFLIYFPLNLLKQNNIKLINLKILLFYSVWIIPGLLFNLFVRTEQAGYQMSYLAGLLMLISYAVWKLTKKSNLLLYVTIIAFAVFNLYWFFYDRDPNFSKPFRPTSFHYSDIRKNDLKIGEKVNYIEKNFDPNNTLLISTEVYWRQYSYYLKNYRIIAINALDNTEVPYNYNRYDSRNWNTIFSNDSNFSIKIPKEINYIIFMDDNASEWIKNFHYKKIKLQANSYISVLKVDKNKVLNFSYHELVLK